MKMHYGTESGLVKANDGRLAGSVIDRHNVKAQRALLEMALAKEIVRGANEGFVFSGGDAQFGEAEFAFDGKTSANLNERQGITIEADEVEFTLGMLRHVVSGDKNIAEAPRVPVSIRFPTHACLQRPSFCSSGVEEAGPERPWRDFHWTRANPMRSSIYLHRYFVDTNLDSINENPAAGEIF
jgi:hypothetical protein